MLVSLLSAGFFSRIKVAPRICLFLSVLGIYFVEDGFFVSSERKIMITKQDAQKLSADYSLIPISKEIPVNGKTPRDVFLALKNLSRQCFILESAAGNEKNGRYTFLGYDPKLTITCRNRNMTIKNGTKITFQTDNPNEEIRRILSDNKSPRISGMPPFTGGLVGYFAYDFFGYSESSLHFEDDNDGFQDVDLMLFDKTIVFDRQQGTIIIIVNIKSDSFEENYNKAIYELDFIERIVLNGERAKPAHIKLLSDFEPLFDKDGFCSMVQEAKRHIFEGDIFQAVLSNSLSAKCEGSLFDTYGILRETNPSPYMFYFSSDETEIAGAAPETLVRLRGDTVFTYPLAGTRPRGKTVAEDELLEQGLLSDEKELAEHNMLVDLGRNDIGKISEFGSVTVPEYMQVLKFSHVMHIGSTVTGKLRNGLDAMDAVSALLPAGTLSGAPKIRACQIISDLEKNRRGLYGGAIGYVAFNGDMDTCIAIRIAYKKNGKVTMRSGAGIVADSIPENEYIECNNKLRAVLNAVKKAGGESV
jgi:anthranilate synthase component 1